MLVHLLNELWKLLHLSAEEKILLKYLPVLYSTIIWILHPLPLLFYLTNNKTKMSSTSAHFLGSESKKRGSLWVFF